MEKRGTPIRPAAQKQREMMANVKPFLEEPSSPSHARSSFNSPSVDKKYKKQPPQPQSQPQLQPQLQSHSASQVVEPSSSSSSGDLKKRRHQMLPALDVKEYLELDAENGLQQRIGDGPQRPHTAQLIFLRRVKDKIKQPANRQAYSLDEIARGAYKLYEKLGHEQKAALEKEAEDMVRRYEDESSKAARTESKSSVSAFSIYEANNKAKMEQLHPGLSSADLKKRLEQEFAALSPEMQKPYIFLAERDRERVRVHASLWCNESALTEGEASNPKRREFLPFWPQYCVHCGNTLICTKERLCQNCGKTYDAKIVGFAVGGTPSSLLPRVSSEHAGWHNVLVTSLSAIDTSSAR